ncbi:MAG: hypothetical protein ACREVT_05030 [Burkholderiales bacterium]
MAGSNLGDRDNSTGIAGIGLPSTTTSMNASFTGASGLVILIGANRAGRAISGHMRKPMMR